MNRPSAYTVVQWTQHYRKLHGTWYRDALARDAAGQLWTVSIREDVAVAA